MPDPRFFSVGGPFTLAQLADIGGATMDAEARADRLIRDVAPIEGEGVVPTRGDARAENGGDSQGDEPPGAPGGERSHEHLEQV